MVTTKEQERKALSKIKKIIADLGENSYLAAAFEGVFELANQNIIDDAAYCFPDRVNKLNRQIKDLNNEKDALINKLKETKTSFDTMDAEYEQLKKRSFSRNEIIALKQLVNSNMEESQNRFESAVSNTLNGGPLCDLQHAYDEINTLKSINKKLHDILYKY